MREKEPSEKIGASNERSLSTLWRAITLSQGHFALILVRCNYEICKELMWQQLQELTDAPLKKLVLQESIKSLYTTILAALAGEQTSALLVFGLESVTAIEQVLVSTNQVREEFRKSLSLPVVLWVTDEVLQKLARFAPDFKSWAATSIKFELATDQLLTLWNQAADELFATILSSDLGQFLPNKALNFAPGCRRRQELEAAFRDLHSRNINLDPAQCATWQFILGRDAFSYDQLDVAIELSHQSLGFWQQELRWVDGEQGRGTAGERGRILAQNSEQTDNSIPPLPPHPLTPSSLECVGVILHHIALCYCRQAELQPTESRSKWQQARELLNAAIEVFATAERSDLVAQLTIKLGEVLQHLESWTGLQALALQSLELHEIQNSPVKLAQVYGFLAVVALVRSNWENSKDLATTALDILEQSQSPQSQHRALYLLVSAKAQRQLGESTWAIAQLEQAINLETLQPNSLQQQPQLYLDILEELRSLYCEQKQYLRAFDLKEEQRSIKQQYGFCTFIGAAPLQPRRRGKGIPNSPKEIVAAGRQPDVNRLIERLSRNDHKLTIIHGSSGVGKSSLINAGLVPTLEARIIGAREVMPVVQKVYRDWVGELEKRLVEALTSWRVERLQVEEELHRSSRLQVESSNQPSNLQPTNFQSTNLQPSNLQSTNLQSTNLQPSNLQPTNLQSTNLQPSNLQPTNLQPSPTQNLQTILEQLRLSYDRNLLTILIFDQFEEFFFVCTNQEHRRQFYDFLEQCLDIPYVKVILSLREDYLHYLLEGERYSNLSAINNNILDRQLRYHLGDLSPEDAKNVISTLAAASQFQLEESLIEALVQDLARSSGTIRLIELQVVGQQLQAEKITTLEQYQAIGAYPVASLVERSLLNVISDCGPENEDTVWQVLFSLTDDRGTRPLKTSQELLSSNLSSSPLWFREPERWENEQQTTDQLDLILKILVGSGLVFRVPDEIQDRYQLVHDYLVEPIRQQYEQRTQFNIVAQLERSEMALLRVRKQQRRAIAVGVTMAVLAVTAAGLGWRAEVQRRLAAALSINAQLSAISTSSEALFVSNKHFDALIEGLRAGRRLKDVETVEPSFLRVEPDIKLQVVTALEQAVYGASERNRLEGHKDVVWNVSFSPDGQLIASASRDKTVKLWRSNGTLVTTLNGHSDSVTSVSFSPDSQLIASGSWDGTVRLWRRDGTAIRTLKGHLGYVYGVSFSPNGQLIASAGADGTVRLWTIDGKLIETFRGHKGMVTWVSFSPTGEMIASASQDKTIKLWTPQGKLLQTLKGHDGKVNCVVFSPDGKTLASGSDDQTVKLWNPTGKLLKTFSKHRGWVFGVAFSADGQLIASASADNTVRLWNRNGSLLKTFMGHSDSVTAVSFSPAGVRDWGLGMRDWEKSSPVTEKKGFQASLFKGNYQKNLPNFKLRPIIAQPIQNPKSKIQNRVTIASNLQRGPRVPQSPVPLLASASLDKTIKLWGPRNQFRLILPHQNDVRDVTFSPDSQLIATAGDDRTVKLWNRTGKLLNTLRGHTDRIDSISFSPDGKTLASASRDGTVRLWTRRGTLIKTLTGHSDWVLNVTFSPDGDRLASASRDGTVKLWSRRGILIKNLTNKGGRVNKVSFSADGQLLASAHDDNTVKLWTADGRLLKTLRGHSNWVLDISFSPDSQMLASASYDDTVKLWSRDGELIRTLRGHTDSVAHVRFSPSGKILATTSWDNRIQLWRLDDTLIKTLEGHKERVTSVSWSNDGKALISASQDNTAIVWNLDLDDLLDKSCYWLREYLQYNPKVRPSDRNLCGPLETPKRDH